MTTGAAPDGAFTGRWRAWRPARRSPSAWAAAPGNPGRTRREDPPPLVADLDCAVRGSDPFLRVCLGSSVTVSPPRRGSPRHGPTSLRTGLSARRCGQYGRTAVADDQNRPRRGARRWPRGASLPAVSQAPQAQPTTARPARPALPSAAGDANTGQRAITAAASASASICPHSSGPPRKHNHGMTRRYARQCQGLACGC